MPFPRIPHGKGPIQSIQIKELNYLGDWKSFLQLVNVKATGKLPFTIMGIVITFKERGDPQGDASDHLKEEENNEYNNTTTEGIHQEGSHSINKDFVQDRLTWYGLLKATILWNFITMSEVTVTDLVVDGQQCFKTAIIVHRMVAYTSNTKPPLQKPESRDGVEDVCTDQKQIGENYEESSKVMVYADSIQFKSHDGSLDREGTWYHVA